MAGRPPTSPALVAEALAKVDELVEALGLGPAREEAARLTGVSVATIRRAQKAAGAAPTAVKGAGSTPKRRSARRAARRPAKAPPPPPPPAPIPLLPDAILEVKAALEQTKGQLFALAGKQGYSAAGNLYDKLLKTLGALERERAKPGAELSHVLGKGPVAVAKIRQGCAAVARREAESGKCARCAAPLAPEVVLNRRTEAGLDAAPVH